MAKEKFEDNLDRLQVIVDQLEKGEVSLDDSIKLLEEGLNIGKKLNKQLEVFENKINDLTNEDNDDE